MHIELRDSQVWELKGRAHKLGVESISCADLELIIRGINDMYEARDTFREFIQDLRRVIDNPELSTGDKARDLMLSYDITRKPEGESW